MDLPFVTDFIELGKELFKQSGKIAMYYYNMDKYPDDFIKMKTDKTPVTKADEEIHRLITEEMEKTFKKRISIISEESDEHKLKKGNYILVLDPLDGTRSYLNHRNQFVMQASLLHRRRGEAVAAIIYKPLEIEEMKIPGTEEKIKEFTTEMYSAIKNQGTNLEITYLKDSKLVKKKLVINPTEELRDGKILISKHSGNDDLADLVNYLDEQDWPKYEKMGSSGYKFAEVAKGNAQAIIKLPTQNAICAWDIYPALIVTEAGGIITDTDMKKIKFDVNSLKYNNGMIVSNSRVHKQTYELLRDWKKKRKEILAK